MLDKRMHEFIVVGLLAMIFTGAVLGWMLWPGGGVESQEAVDPVAVQPVLQQLGPGTTFHMVDVVYRRYGPAAADIPSSEGPETRRIEYWISFDDQGALAELRIETRDSNGTILSTGVLEGADLVFRDASGVETDRQANVGAGVTLDGANFDRGPSAGPNPWNMTAPDGSIDLFIDILGVIKQYGHDCASN